MWKICPTTTITTTEWLAVLLETPPITSYYTITIISRSWCDASQAPTRFKMKTNETFKPV